MTGFLDALDDRLYEKKRTQRLMTASPYTQKLIDSLVPPLVEQMHDMDLSDVPTYGGRRLLPLGEARGQVRVGMTTCGRFAFLGEDGKFYVQGPHPKGLFNVSVVFDIHPYGEADTSGDWGGLSIREIAEMLVPYFV